MISRALRTSAAGVQAEKALTGVHTRRSGRAAGFSRPSAGGGFSRGRDCSGVLQAGVVPWRGGMGYSMERTLLRTALAYVEPRVETRWRLQWVT